MAKIIIALDFDNLQKASTYLNSLKKEANIFKIGLQLFTRYGPRAVEMVKKEGAEVFLDLKIHDIPSISAKAVEFASEAGCYSTTVHIQAGPAALKRAVEAKKRGNPRIWGVTVLSSMPEGDSMGLAKTASLCGLDGLIVSGEDLKKVKERYPELKCAVPGIRPAGYNGKDDQERVLTPAGAVERGADYLVIGRAVRDSDDPLQTLKEIKKDAGI